MKYIVISGCSFFTPSFYSSLCEKFDIKNLGVCVFPDGTTLETTEVECNKMTVKQFGANANSEFIHKRRLSKSGGSNDRICRTMIEWLNSHYDDIPNTLFIIGVTELCRLERWDNLENDYVDIILTDFLKSDNKFYKKYFNEKHEKDKLNRYLKLFNNIISTNGGHLIVLNSLDEVATHYKDYNLFSFKQYDKDYTGKNSWKEYQAYRAKDSPMKEKWVYVDLLKESPKTLTYDGWWAGPDNIHPGNKSENWMVNKIYDFMCDYSGNVIWKE